MWSASILNRTLQNDEDLVRASLSQGLRGVWLSATNAEFRPPGAVLEVLRQGLVRDLTVRPSLPLVEYFGACKTNTCSNVPGVVVVPVPIIPIRPPPIRK